MPKFVGFQSMMIPDPYGITFDVVGVFGLAFQLLFKYWSTYCGFEFFEEAYAIFLNIKEK